MKDDRISLSYTQKERKIYWRTLQSVLIYI